MRKRRTWAWLLLTAGLLGVVAWLSTSGGSEVKATEIEPHIPRSMSGDEHARLRERVVHALPVTDGGEVDAFPPPRGPGPAAPRDPLIAALPIGKGKSAMVIEANALWNSDLREPMLACLFGGEQANVIEGMRDAGFDLAKDLDRVAVMDKALMVSGNLKNVSFLPPGSLAQVTANTRLLKTETEGVFAVWKDQLMIIGKTEDEVMATIRRLESDTPPTDPRVLNDRDTYGDVYGRIDVDRFARLAGEGEFSTFFDEVRKGASSVSFHVDASHDVGISLGMEGNASEEAQQLRKTLAGAIALGRMRAKATGDERLFRLLDMAEVTPASGKDGAQFSLELALPHAFVVELLEDCAKRVHAFKEPPPAAKAEPVAP